jgi:hypothetical protein
MKHNIRVNCQGEGEPRHHIGERVDFFDTFVVLINVREGNVEIDLEDIVSIEVAQ